MRRLVQLHRWLGIGLCLFFAAWFLSGAVMIYVPFPSLSNPQRWAGSAPVEVARLTVAPARALAAAGPAPVERLRLLDFAGRPVYVLHYRDGTIGAIGADDGLPARSLSRQQARNIAAAFASRPVQAVEGPLDTDQWIVPNLYDAYRPFYRVRLDDADETVLYVSARTGEVLQRTLGYERIWNYFGSVVHWAYPTVLRKHADLWRHSLWWLSLCGLLVVIAGLWIGLSRMRAARLRGRAISLYRGWHRWHHVMGLCAGLLLLTWIFSGWLSVDPGWLFSDPAPTERASARYRGMPLAQAASEFDLDDLAARPGNRELEITAIGSTPLLLARDGHTVRAYTADAKLLEEDGALPRALIVDAVRAAWPEHAVAAVDALGADDTYGNVREAEVALPASTLRLVLDDAERTWVHVDAASGEIVSIMDSGRRARRWLFNALHGFDLPGLASRRPLWDVLIVSSLMLGFLFSATSAVIGMKRLAILTRSRAGAARRSDDKRGAATPQAKESSC